VQTDENTVFRIYRANGLQMFPASSNDPAVRRGALERPLTRMVAGGKPGIVFSPNCVKLRKGLAGGFFYKRVRVAGDEKYRDVPEKNQYSHVVEALEYALMDAGENVKVGGAPVASAGAQQGGFRTPPMPQGPGKFGWSPHDI
jgi:hypothetical protein